MKCVVFDVKNETFALPVEQVCEVLHKPKLRDLPEASEFLAGLIPLRKHSVAVMDLAKKLRLDKKSGESLSKHVLVVSEEEFLMGLLVDEVKAVTDLDESKMDELEKFSMGQVQGRVLKGVLQTSTKPIFLLDLKQVLKNQKDE